MNKIGEITRINRAINAIEQSTLREPSPQQLAEYLHMDIKKVKDALGCAPWTASYDFSMNDDGYSMLDNLPCHGPATDEGLIAESQAFETRQLLSELSEREVAIIELTYGLGGGQEMSPFDISKHIGLSSERVRQIRNNALEKLRNTGKIAPLKLFDEKVF